MSAACTPAKPLGPAGQVNLVYSGESQTEFFFVLENRSPQELLVPVSKSFRSVKPYGAAVGCLAEDSSYESSIWPPLDGGERQEVIKIPPEGQQRLNVDKGDFAMPRYRHGRCDIRLPLKDHAAVELKNFRR
jgi:hypothetical protein